MGFLTRTWLIVLILLTSRWAAEPLLVSTANASEYQLQSDEPSDLSPGRTTSEAASLQAPSELIFVSLPLGALIILVLYHLVLGVTMKASIHLHYVMYLLAFLSVQIIFSGIARSALGPDLDAWIPEPNEGWHVTIKITWAIAFSLSAHFLKPASLPPFGTRGLKVLTLVMASSVLTGFFWSEQQDAALLLGINAGSSFLLLSLGIWSTRRGYRPARWYAGSWAFLAFVFGTMTLPSAGLLPIPPVGVWFPVVGAALHGLALSLALSERSDNQHQLSAANQEAQLKKLLDKEAAHAHHDQELGKIIYPHQVDLILQGVPLEKTMPTGPSEACVIAFNTVGSSKMDRRKARAFLRETFALCYRDMLAGYDPKTLQANAYRVKEVSDGFVCTIGFPFATPDEQNPAELALQLARRFSKHFHAVAQRHGLMRLPQASIAITWGEVEAYYPVAGVMDYHVFGRGIVLADRYEKLRKGALRQLVFTGNLLVIDSRSFSMLSPASQVLFQRFDVDAVQQTIRDDEQAHCFYFTELRHESARQVPASA